MNCIDCHTSTELHGDFTSPQGDLPAHRYDGSQVPNCRDCHEEVGIADDGIQMHQMYGENLSCQVCYSESYTSCDSCHVAFNEESGNLFFRTEAEFLVLVLRGAIDQV